MAQITDATPISFLTVGQLETLTRQWVREETASMKADAPAPTSKRHVYGLAGLAKLLGCSETTACKVNTSGVIDAALTRLGNLLIFDADLVLELIKKHEDDKKTKNAKRSRTK